MHQPFYKDLVNGEYRLPWVRLHALKDYYGMVKLLDEFPRVHQTFNLVPSLIAQIEDYVAGTAKDPFFDVAAKPAQDLTAGERAFALEYLFQANPTHMIGRFPRYQQLWEQKRSHREPPEKSHRYFSNHDFTDLQVLSQLAWFDEFFLEEPEVAELVRKGSGFTIEEQTFVVQRERELLARVLPAYKRASQQGSIEISTSPFYHPILPLLCDTDVGRVSSPGLPLPSARFRQPDDAREQLRRGLQLHEQQLEMHPRGCWPSEGSVSEEVLQIAGELGLQWLATDEGVLGRSLGFEFQRDAHGVLGEGAPERLYRVYRFTNNAAPVHLLFRDHALSDLIGFVYSGMQPKEAVQHFMRRLKDSAQPLLDKGEDATVAVILDGENAWEYYPHSGREFLRQLYAAIGEDAAVQASTVSEAIVRETKPRELRSLVPGSWINANFNVWIGAPEDNKAWEYLAAAREFYAREAPRAEVQKQALAKEEIFIAEGSDWNWWYGPEHHSANDRDFDELYRKHLSNVYLMLGSTPPEYLAQPIIPVGIAERAYVVPQTAYIHPQIEGDTTRYFDWIGAAMATADRHTSAMHGKEFILEALRAGIDEENLYLRLDFARDVSHETLELRFQIECPGAGAEADRRHHLRVTLENQTLTGWSIREEGVPAADGAMPPDLRLLKVFEARIPLVSLGAQLGRGKLRLRCSVWRNGVPVDALPLEGSLGLNLVEEQDLEELAYGSSR
jgi:alpha-amylase/alpha-mannosidase (GH57 family)